MKNNIISFDAHRKKELAQRKSKYYQVSQCFIANIIEDLDKMGYNVYDNEDLIDDFLVMEEMVNAILNKRMENIDSPIIKYIDIIASEYVKDE